MSKQVVHPRAKKVQGDSSVPINIELALDTFIRNKPLFIENVGDSSVEKAVDGCRMVGNSCPNDSALDLTLWSFPLSNPEHRSKKIKDGPPSGRPLLVEKFSKQGAELVDLRRQLNDARSLIASKDTEIARLKRLIKTLHSGFDFSSLNAP